MAVFIAKAVDSSPLTSTGLLFIILTFAVAPKDVACVTTSSWMRFITSSLVFYEVPVRSVS